MQAALVSTATVVVVLLLCGCGTADDAGTEVNDSVNDSVSNSLPTSTRSFGALAYVEPEEDGSDPDPSVPLRPGTTEGPDQGTSTTEPGIPARNDGIELLFADGALGPAKLGATIQEIAAALGPGYVVQPEGIVRAGFPSGHSVSRDDQVLFWAIEEDGVITDFMTSSPRVGLESGLRPGLPLVDAVALHGEPRLFIGTEQREFAAFEDGTGDTAETAAGDLARLSVLVAIGQFGGPVGVYAGGAELGAETADYLTEDANVKELWFQLR